MRQTSIIERYPGWHWGWCDRCFRSPWDAVSKQKTLQWRSLRVIPWNWMKDPFWRIACLRGLTLWDVSVLKAISLACMTFSRSCGRLGSWIENQKTQNVWRSNESFELMEKNIYMHVELFDSIAIPDKFRAETPLHVRNAAEHVQVPQVLSCKHNLNIYVYQLQSTGACTRVASGGEFWAT